MSAFATPCPITKTDFIVRVDSPGDRCFFKMMTEKRGGAEAAAERDVFHYEELYEALCKLQVHTPCGGSGDSDANLRQAGRS